MWVLNKHQISSGCEGKSKYSYRIQNTLPSIFFSQNIAGRNFSIDSLYFYFKISKFQSVTIFGNLNLKYFLNWIIVNLVLSSSGVSLEIKSCGFPSLAVFWYSLCISAEFRPILGENTVVKDMFGRNKYASIIFGLCIRTWFFPMMWFSSVVKHQLMKQMIFYCAWPLWGLEFFSGDFKLGTSYVISI